MIENAENVIKCEWTNMKGAQSIWGRMVRNEARKILKNRV